MNSEPSGNQWGLSGLASLSKNVPTLGNPGVSSGKSLIWQESHPGASVSALCIQAARK